MKRVLVQLLILIAVSVAAAAVANTVHPVGLPWVFNLTQITRDPQTSPVDLAEAKRLFDDGGAVFMDSRPVSEFDAGHIRGAESVPVEEFDDHLDDVLARFSPDRPLVVYCSGEECMSSVHLAEKLVEYGYLDIRVFFGGWPEWKAAGYPTGGPWD
jgi:rhodanese-related sulfurtransferase